MLGTYARDIVTKFLLNFHSSTFKNVLLSGGVSRVHQVHFRKYFPSRPMQNPYPTKMFPRESHGMVYAFRHIPRMPSFPPTTCFWKSYSNTPKSHSSLPGAIIPSRSISPLTGTLMSARNPNFICFAVAFQSA